MTEESSDVTLADLPKPKPPTLDEALSNACVQRLVDRWFPGQDNSVPAANIALNLRKLVNWALEAEHKTPEGPRHDAAATFAFVVERILESDKVPQHKLALVEEAVQRFRGGVM